MAPLPPTIEVVEAHSVAVAGLPLYLYDLHQPLRLGKGKGTKNSSIEGAEDRSRSPDAKG